MRSKFAGIQKARVGRVRERATGDLQIQSSRGSVREGDRKALGQLGQLFLFVVEESDFFFNYKLNL